MFIGAFAPVFALTRLGWLWLPYRAARKPHNAVLTGLLIELHGETEPPIAHDLL